MMETDSPTALLERPPMPRKPTPKPEAPEAKPTVLSIKGTNEWRDWLQRGARHCRTDVAKLVDAAVVEYLTKRGFSEKPPER